MFDGYERGSTKDHIQSKRYPIRSVDVLYNAEQKLLTKKSIYLSNPTKKQRFIDELSKYLAGEGVHVTKTDGDADFAIVKKATDLLALDMIRWISVQVWF